MGPYSCIDNVQPRLFADIEVPLSAHFDLGLTGQVASGELGMQWSAGAIASYRTGF